ncbi:hypothetical protein NDU88_002006 [Pleurodeles waltl]|uniref:Uncharacterized protein n=1 Tax=Pleurodeles waltl TaxID=8319 RepID=A0AAV7UUA9_PLEWA|nr:hypothetical protein NDU88_002006 [Pleurodeles waltl]
MKLTHLAASPVFGPASNLRGHHRPSLMRAQRAIGAQATLLQGGSSIRKALGASLSCRRCRCRYLDLHSAGTSAGVLEVTGGSSPPVSVTDAART